MLATIEITDPALLHQIEAARIAWADEHEDYYARNFDCATPVLPDFLSGGEPGYHQCGYAALPGGGWRWLTSRGNFTVVVPRESGATVYLTGRRCGIRVPFVTCGFYDSERVDYDPTTRAITRGGRLAGRVVKYDTTRDDVPPWASGLGNRKSGDEEATLAEVPPAACDWYKPVPEL